MTWLQDMNWPVAQALLPLLIGYQNETTPMATQILRPEQEDDIWKYWIITSFAPALSADNQRALMNDIRRIAWHPTAGERIETVDEAARAFLDRG